MFAGAQIVTTKLVPHGSRNQTVDVPSEDRTTQDLINMIKNVPRSKAAIIVETRTEKYQRKLLAQERRQERLIEQQKIAQQMEKLMERVLRETPLPKKDEINLRQKIKSIMTKVNKDLDRSNISSIHPSLIEPTSSISQIISDSLEGSSRSQMAMKTTDTMNQAASLLWYDRTLH